MQHQIYNKPTGSVSLNLHLSQKHGHIVILFFIFSFWCE